MQAARIPIRFQGFFPASIFVFKTQVPSNHQIHFDFMDNPYLLTIACRLGHVAIIAALQDGGAQKAVYGGHMSRYTKLALHPYQFTELTTLVFHRALLFNRTPKHMTVESGGELLVHQMPLAGLSAKPLFNSFDPFEYARHLSARTGFPIDQLYEAPNKVRTWLEDSKGKLLKLDVLSEDSSAQDRRVIREAIRGIAKEPLR